MIDQDLKKNLLKLTRAEQQSIKSYLVVGVLAVILQPVHMLDHLLYPRCVNRNAEAPVASGHQTGRTNRLSVRGKMWRLVKN